MLGQRQKNQEEKTSSEDVRNTAEMRVQISCLTAVNPHGLKLSQFLWSSGLGSPLLEVEWRLLGWAECHDDEWSG